MAGVKFKYVLMDVVAMDFSSVCMFQRGNRVCCYYLYSVGQAMAASTKLVAFSTGHEGPLKVSN